MNKQTEKNSVSTCVQILKILDGLSVDLLLLLSLLLLKKVKLMAKRTIRITKSCRCRISSTDLSKRQV